MSIAVCQGCGVEFTAGRRDAKWCPGCGANRNSGKYSRYEQAHRGRCEKCGAEGHRKMRVCRKCTVTHGEHNPNWRGGHTMHPSGYRQIHVGGERRYEMEHRQVWERAHGPIPKGMEVHHLNGIRTDNRLENLMAMSRRDHHTQHEVYEKRIRVLEARIRELEDT